MAQNSEWHSLQYRILSNRYNSICRSIPRNQIWLKYKKCVSFGFFLSLKNGVSSRSRISLSPFRWLFGFPKLPLYKAAVILSCHSCRSRTRNHQTFKSIHLLLKDVFWLVGERENGNARAARKWKKRIEILPTKKSSQIYLPFFLSISFNLKSWTGHFSKGEEERGEIKRKLHWSGDRAFFGKSVLKIDIYSMGKKRGRKAIEAACVHGSDCEKGKNIFKLILEHAKYMWANNVEYIYMLTIF